VLGGKKEVKNETQQDMNKGGNPKSSDDRGEE